MFSSHRGIGGKIMKKKSIILLLTLVMMACLSIGVTACGKKPEEENPQCQHTTTVEFGEAKEATCGTDGLTVGIKCVLCNTIIQDQTVIPATGEHDFTNSTTFGSDETHHWEKCAVCGADNTVKQEHDGSATCVTKATCSVCEKVYGEFAEHDYSVVGKDANNHWKQCSVCEEIEEGTTVAHSGGSATCTSKATCGSCGEEYGEKAPHDFTNSELFFDANNHWKQCTVCGEPDEANKTAHTGGTADCVNAKVCEVCSASYGEPLGHDFVGSTVYITENGKHWKKCANCTVEDIANKIDCNGGTASCTALAKCADCGEEYGELASHDFINGELKFDDLWHWKKCANCDVEDVTNKEAHKGGVADCLNAGACTVCGEEYIDALGHDMKQDWEVDENKHWKKCLRTDCDYVEEEGAHVGGEATCQTKAVCSTCGSEYGSLANHDYDLTAWGYKGDDGHAHLCKMGCGSHDDLVAHTPNVENATETVAKVCTECEYVIEPMVGHVHVQSTTYSSDANSHWFACSGCGSYKFPETVASHVFDNACDTTCDTCGYTRITTHVYNTVKTSATEHWKVCDVCKLEQVGSRALHSGGTATCTEKAICNGCQKAYGSALGHDFASSTTYVSSETQHWKKCNRCDVSDEANKVAHGGEATCQAPATCPDCKKVYGTTRDHNFADGPYLSDATHHWKKCKDCDAVDTTKSVHAGGSASCTEKAKCSVCNAEYGEPLGHDYSGNLYGTNASEHWRKCSRCDVAEATKSAHTGGTATCISKAKCSTCGVEYGGTLGHSLTKYASDGDKH